MQGMRKHIWLQTFGHGFLGCYFYLDILKNTLGGKMNYKSVVNEVQVYIIDGEPPLQYIHLQNVKNDWIRFFRPLPIGTVFKWNMKSIFRRRNYEV